MSTELPPLTPMICSYPECSNMFWVTVQQKREMKTYNVLKYGDSSDAYCSIECQQKHLRDLSLSEFLDKKALKNRDYALVVRGAEEQILKRPKECEVRVITGNKTEQRIDCLKEKVVSMSQRTIKLKDTTIKARFVYPNEIQYFFMNEVPKKLTISDRCIHVAASKLMNKCVEVYPDLFSLEDVDEKTRVLILIKPLL